MTPQERSDKLAKIYEVINFPYDEGDAVYSPVMIGDVLDWIEPLKETRGIKNIYFYTNTVGDLLKIWKYKRLPIDDQSDECVIYIYSLIK